MPLLEVIANWTIFFVKLNLGVLYTKVLDVPSYLVQEIIWNWQKKKNVY